MYASLSGIFIFDLPHPTRDTTQDSIHLHPVKTISNARLTRTMYNIPAIGLPVPYTLAGQARVRCAAWLNQMIHSIDLPAHDALQEDDIHHISRMLCVNHNMPYLTYTNGMMLPLGKTSSFTVTHAGNGTHAGRVRLEKEDASIGQEGQASFALPKGAYRTGDGAGLTGRFISIDDVSGRCVWLQAGNYDAILRVYDVV